MDELFQRSSLSLLGIVCASVLAHANPTGPLEYRAGTEAFAAGEFDKARAHFQSDLRYSPSAAAYHGFAEANLASGDVPGATWAVRSAELLGGTPTLPQLRARAYADLPADLTPLPLGGIDGLAARVSRLPFPNLAALLALLCYAAVGALLMRQLSHRRDQPFTAPWPAIIVGVVVGNFALWVAFRQNALVEVSEAVVIAPADGSADSLQLRSAPSGSAPAARALPAGAVVTTAETLASFTEVVLPTGERGWLPTNRLWPVRPLAPTWPE